LILSQAAGLIPLVHASAGPLLDIVVPFESKPTGYHATSADSFAAQLSIIFEMTNEEIGEMRERARRNAVERFSTEGFERGWEEGWSQLKSVNIV
jgi:alpha-1,2-mannosyltransferase